ncbi:response regulator transcription factor [Argonema galeatum]|uniref:response regulator transcription factor n=1 Tax=Argonema galeatum TaxID=2942762 RepID=UPI0020136118|nr:response regulator [Argonema galeatum]MCL1464100.1 response regulator [Argonema galeatum A003/A1]
MKKILLIDDNEEIRELIGYFLSLENYEAIATDKGRLGLELAKKVKPDLIICDIRMPGLDGYAVLKALREDWTTAKIPFIFLSAETDCDSRCLARELGSDDYLTKPVDFDELLQAIAAQIKKIRYP